MDTTCPDHTHSGKYTCRSPNLIYHAELLESIQCACSYRLVHVFEHQMFGGGCRYASL